MNKSAVPEIHPYVGDFSTDAEEQQVPYSHSVGTDWRQLPPLLGGCPGNSLPGIRVRKLDQAAAVKSPGR